MAENEIPQRPEKGEPIGKPDEEDFSFGYLSSEARSAYQSVLDQLREEFSGTTPTDEQINERIADYLSYLSPQITAALTPFEVKMRVDLQKVLQKESDKGKTEDLVEPSETEPEELEKWLKKKKQTIRDEFINFDKRIKDAYQNRKELLSEEEKEQIRSEFFNIINPVLAEIDEIKNRHQDDPQLQAFIQDIDSIKTAFFHEWPVEKSEAMSPHSSSEDENVAEPRAEEQKEPQNPNEPENSKDSGNPEGPENAEEWVEKQRERFQNKVEEFVSKLELDPDWEDRKNNLSQEEKKKLTEQFLDLIAPFYTEARIKAKSESSLQFSEWISEILSQRDNFLSKLKSEEEAKVDLQQESQEPSESEALLRSITSGLLLIKSQSYFFTEDQDPVEDAFVTIKEQLKDLKKDFTFPEKERKDLEKQVVELEYRKRREAFLVTLERLERTQSLGENSFGRSLETPGLNRLKNLAIEAESLGSEKAEKFKNDLKKLEKHYNSRKWLFFSWLQVRQNLFDGVGAENARTSFKQVGQQEFPISGADFQELICGGADFDEDGEFENHLSDNLGTVTRTVPIFGELDPETREDARGEKTTHETTFSMAMELFDKYYREGTPVGLKDENGKILPQVTTRNLRENQAEFIDIVYRELQSKVRGKGTFSKEKTPNANTYNFDSEAKISKHAIELAFRTHVMLTMHHSRFASGSPSLRDDWYYAFRFPEYAYKYFDLGVDKFDPFAFFFIFNANDGLNEKGEPSDENLLVRTFGKGKVKSLLRKLKDKGLWNRPDRGLKNFDGFVKGFAIKLVDVSNEKRSKSPEFSFLAPPMRFLRLRDGSGQYLTHAAEKGNRGLQVLLDDYYDEEGNIVYSDLNYSDLGTDLTAYYNSMNEHGINNFLNKFVKIDRFEFMKNARDPSILKNLKNEARYTVSLLPRVGIFALMGDADPNQKKDSNVKIKVDVEIMDKILLQIIFVNCLLHTDPSAQKDVFWNPLSVRQYLTDLVSQGIITTEEQTAIYTSVSTYRGIGFYLRGLLLGVGEQVEKSNLFK